MAHVSATEKYEGTGQRAILESMVDATREVQTPNSRGKYDTIPNPELRPIYVPNSNSSKN